MGINYDWVFHGRLDAAWGPPVNPHYMWLKVLGDKIAALCLLACLSAFLLVCLFACLLRLLITAAHTNLVAKYASFYRGYQLQYAHLLVVIMLCLTV
jgi:hypothetical protein